jgi:hypothetical protein
MPATSHRFEENPMVRSASPSPGLPPPGSTALARLAILLLPLVLPSWLPAAASAQTWNEIGDAGSLPATAQVTVGSGGLASLNGNLASASDVDMYCFKIAGASTFLARLQCVAIQGPNLWLFDATGKGVAANSFCQGGDKRVTNAFMTGAGTYYVAVSFDGVNPFSGANPIWIPNNVPERAPDGAGAAGAVTSWQGTGNVQPLNPYTILFTSATFCDSPTADDAGTWGRLKQLYR